MITAVRKRLGVCCHSASDQAQSPLLGARIPGVVTDPPSRTCRNAFEQTVLREPANSVALHACATPNRITAPLTAKSTRIVGKLSPPDSTKLHVGWQCQRLLTCECVARGARRCAICSSQSATSSTVVLRRVVARVAPGRRVVHAPA